MKGYKIDWNIELRNTRFLIRVCEGYTQKYMKLTNGIELRDFKAIQFGRRLRTDWNMDLAYHINEDIRNTYIRQRVSDGARKGGISCQEQNPHVREIAKENCRKMRESGKNLGFQKGHISWNIGLTKETNLTLLHLSQERTGEGNPMFGHKHTEEYKLNASVIMKENIKSGRFTPNIKNSRTHLQYEYKGLRFRSSWEATWYALNPLFEYETVRISYWLDGKERIYIVDFYDPVTNTLVEIKPKEHTYSAQFKAKKEYATKWAEDNNGQYIVITQEYLKENLPRILVTDLPEDIKVRMKGLK